MTRKLQAAILRFRRISKSLFSIEMKFESESQTKWPQPSNACVQNFLYTPPWNPEPSFQNKPDFFPLWESPTRQAVIVNQ